MILFIFIIKDFFACVQNGFEKIFFTRFVFNR
jgi:hypothetical protein